MPGICINCCSSGEADVSRLNVGSAPGIAHRHLDYWIVNARQVVYRPLHVAKIPKNIAASDSNTVITGLFINMSEIDPFPSRRFEWSSFGAGGVFFKSEDILFAFKGLLFYA